MTNNFFSHSLCIVMCLFMCAFCLKALLQTAQVKGRSPEWTRMWAFRLYLEVKSFPQSIHWTQEMYICIYCLLYGLNNFFQTLPARAGRGEFNFTRKSKLVFGHIGHKRHTNFRKYSDMKKDYASFDLQCTLFGLSELIISMWIRFEKYILGNKIKQQQKKQLYL